MSTGSLVKSVQKSSDRSTSGTPATVSREVQWEIPVICPGLENCGRGQAAEGQGFNTIAEMSVMYRDTPFIPPERQPERTGE